MSIVEWKCCGCGLVSVDKVRRCACTTDVLFAQENGKLIHEVKIGEIMGVRQSKADSNRAYLDVECLPHKKQNGVLCAGGQCGIPLIKGNPINGNVPRWGWDGDLELPTITPSYWCNSCGLHITITRGIESGRP